MKLVADSSSQVLMSERADHNLTLDLVRVTEAAALAAGHWMGCGQKEAGDGAPVEAMRLMLSTIDMDGVVVIGEGAKDKAPMLFDGKRIGNGSGPAVDVAVDPSKGLHCSRMGAQTRSRSSVLRRAGRCGHPVQLIT